MAEEHYVYRYQWKNRIIYIGKADVSLQRRIEEHSREEKFLSFLEEVNISCIQLANATETTFMELYLINKYKPFLNVVAKYEGMTNIFVQEPEWIPYEQYLSEKNKISPEQELEVIQNELEFWEIVQDHLLKFTYDTDYKNLSLRIPDIVCPKPVPTGFKVLDHTVEVISMAYGIGDTVVLTFRPDSRRNIAYLHEYIFIKLKRASELCMQIEGRK